MNKMIVFFLTAMAMAFSPPNSVLAEKVLSIHAEWGYTAPAGDPAVKGFKLYQEGVEVVEWLGADSRSGDTVCRFVSKATNFTLTVTFVDGSESPHSAPYNFVIENFISTPSGFMVTKAYPPLRRGGERVFVPYKEGIELVKLKMGAKI